MSSQSDDLVVVASFSNRPEADLARGALEAAGIDAVVRSDDTGAMRPHMAWSRGVEIIVRVEDVDHAREILHIPAKPA